MLLLLDPITCWTWQDSLTPVVDGLLPEDALQVPGPASLHFHAGRLKSICVLGLPPPEPDLKTQAAIPTAMGHAYV